MFAEDEVQPLTWCVVANVAAETAHGPGGVELRRGTRHFAAGAKVWVLPKQWGDGGEDLMVVGRHRANGRQYVRMVLPRRHLTNFRVRGVYSPALLRALTRPGPGRAAGPRLWADRDEAERSVAWWSTHPMWARSADATWYTLVSDPPPLELDRDGHPYHLAHFNAYRAIYSSQPPPAEPPKT